MYIHMCPQAIQFVAPLGYLALGLVFSVPEVQPSSWGQIMI